MYSMSIMVNVERDIGQEGQGKSFLDTLRYSKATVALLGVFIVNQVCSVLDRENERRVAKDRVEAVQDEINALKGGISSPIASSDPRRNTQDFPDTDRHNPSPSEADSIPSSWPQSDPWKRRIRIEQPNPLQAGKLYSENYPTPFFMEEDDRKENYLEGLSDEDLRREANSYKDILQGLGTADRFSEFLSPSLLVALFNDAIQELKKRNQDTSELESSQIELRKLAYAKYLELSLDSLANMLLSEDDEKKTQSDPYNLFVKIEGELKAAKEFQVPTQEYRERLDMCKPLVLGDSLTFLHAQITRGLDVSISFLVVKDLRKRLEQAKKHQVIARNTEEAIRADVRTFLISAYKERQGKLQNSSDATLKLIYQISLERFKDEADRWGITLDD